MKKKLILLFLTILCLITSKSFAETKINLNDQTQRAQSLSRNIEVLINRAVNIANQSNDVNNDYKPDELIELKKLVSFYDSGISEDIARLRDLYKSNTSYADRIQMSNLATILINYSLALNYLGLFENNSTDLDSLKKSIYYKGRGDESLRSYLDMIKN